MLKKRLLTAAVLIPLVIWGVLALPTPALAVAFGLFVLLGAWEWAGLIGLTSTPRRIFYVLLVSLGLAAAWDVLLRPSGVGLVLGAGVLWWLAALAWLGRHSVGALLSPSTVALKALAGFLTLVPAWAALVALHRRPELGPYLVLLLLLLIWVADTGAYFAGRRWGRKKLAPQISPGKTLAGLYGGVASAGLVALAGGVLMGMDPVHLLPFLIVALLTVLFSVVGDLFESMMKRHSGVKDSGRLFPGHGGVLDRIDSLTAAAPVFLLGVVLLRGAA